MNTLSRRPALSLIVAAMLALSGSLSSAQAETIRVAIGTQDTTINCATGGLLIRELKLLEKYLPRTGKYKDAKYEIVWKNFTSGAPLTNEMVAGKLDLGAMADFPGSNNGAAFKASGQNYDGKLADYAKLPLKANDAVTGKPITDFQRVAGLWVQGEPKVRHYASIEGAFADLQRLEQQGRKTRAVYVHDLIHRIKLLAPNTWFVQDGKGQLSAFLQKDAATAYASANQGRVLDFASARGAAPSARQAAR